MRNTTTALHSSGAMEETAEPSWKAPQEIGNVVITRCDPIPLRLMDARVMFEPSAYGDNAEGAKNIYFDLPCGVVRTYLEMQEEKLDFVKSCLAKPGLVKCKLDLKRVRVFDADKQLTSQPSEWSKWTVNALVQFIGTWQNSDACGLSLYVSDIQLLSPYQPSCPF